LGLRLAFAEMDASLPMEPDPSGEDMFEKRLLFGEFDDQRFVAGSIPRFGGCMYVSQASFWKLVCSVR
jgi:hypothetical protein